MIKDGLATTIFNLRYRQEEQESYSNACSRLATTMVSKEPMHLIDELYDDFYRMVYQQDFIPGGRIWYGAGRKKSQMINCYVLPSPDDSREGWGKLINDTIIISGMGGGVGVNLSSIRPRGARIKGIGGTATGAVSLARCQTAVGKEIQAGGGRRTALMICLDVTHPDIFEFIEAKNDLSENMNTANISVCINSQFINAVHNDLNWELNWKGEIVKKYKAREIWNKIVDSAYKCGDPGFLNIDLANKKNTIWYHKPLVATNPCGEQWLEAYGACDLGAVNLSNFVTSDLKFDATRFSHVVKRSVRFLDNVLDINQYPLPEIQENCQTVRRVGLGVMGLHHMLLKMGLSYTSKEGLEMIHRVMFSLKNFSYQASAELAAEKGSFKVYDKEKHSQSLGPLNPYTRDLVNKAGLRNCTLNTIAPTGTTSIMASASSGIEPMFAPIYERTYYSGEERATEMVVDPLLRDFVDRGQRVDHFQGAYELTPKEHLNVQHICGEYIDNSISKTINLPNDYPLEGLKEDLLHYAPLLKGTTIYRDGSKEIEGKKIEPLKVVPKDKWDKILYNNDVELGFDENVGCKNGTCDI